MQAIPAPEIDHDNQAVVEHRRSLVARFLARGYSRREILLELAKSPREGEPPLSINPETGQPWTMHPIDTDIHTLRQLWKAEALRDITDIKAQINAELEEVKHTAWTRGDLQSVLKAIGMKIKLFGADSPTEELADKVAREISEETGVPFDKVLEEIQRQKTIQRGK